MASLNPDQPQEGADTLIRGRQLWTVIQLHPVLPPHPQPFSPFLTKYGWSSLWTYQGHGTSCRYCCRDNQVHE